MFPCRVMSAFNFSALLNHLRCVRIVFAQKQLIFVGLPSVIFTAAATLSTHTHAAVCVCVCGNTRNARNAKYATFPYQNTGPGEFVHIKSE